MVGIILAACARDDSAPRPDTVTPDSLAPAIASIASQSPLGREALGRLPALRSGILLGEWKSSFPTDSIDPYAPDAAEDATNDWCARAIANVSLDSALTATRTAYFYVPSVPASAALPVDAAPRQLVEQCRLGFIWTETIEPDRQRASQLGEEIAGAFIGALGPKKDSAKVQWWGAGRWRDTGLWISDGVELVATVDSGPRWGDDETPNAPHRVVVIAAASRSGITLERRGSEWKPGVAAYDASVVGHRRTAARIEQALAAAQLDDSAERPVRSILASMRDDPTSSRARTPAEQAAIVDAVDQLLTVTRDLPSHQRAAALVVADQIIDEFERLIWLGRKDRPALRARFEAHGATFEYSSLGAWFVPARSWLKQAVAVDSTGRGGELAFLTLMEMGFETSVACREQKGKGFRAVIARGEQHLRDRPGSSIDADVHLMIAQAYGDIVALANGGAYEESEGAAYAAEAPAARASAIEHYRAAFASGLAPETMRATWPNAWRLMAGLTPTRTFFYCVYD